MTRKQCEGRKANRRLKGLNGNVWKHFQGGVMTIPQGFVLQAMNSEREI